jgi:hypothetical protein
MTNFASFLTSLISLTHSRFAETLSEYRQVAVSLHALKIPSSRRYNLMLGGFYAVLRDWFAQPATLTSRDYLTWRREWIWHNTR